MIFSDLSQIKDFKNKFIVYGLVDSLTNNLRYIGVSSQLRTRYNYHKNVCLRSSNKKEQNSHKTNWLRKLNSENGFPLLKIIEICSSVEEMKKRERYWIRYFKKRNIDLVNSTDGGDGQSRSYRASEETKRKQSINIKKAQSTPEVKQKMREGRKRYIENNPNWYKGLTEKALLSIRANATKRKGIGIWEKGKMPEEIKRKIKETRNKNDSWLGTRIQDNFGNIYKNMEEAAKAYQTDRSWVSRILNNKAKARYGITFRKI